MADRLSEALLIAASPLVAYLFAFTYEAGSASIFGIPARLINISSTTVFVVTGALLTIAFTLFWTTNLVFMLLPIGEHVIKRKIARLSPALLMLSGLLLIERGRWLGWIGVLVALVLFGVLEFALPLVIHRDRKTYRERLEADEESEDNARQKTLVTYLAHRVGPGGWNLIVYLLISLYVTGAAGRSAARNQEDFLVNSSMNPEVAALTVYGDMVVASRFDRREKTVERAFMFLRLIPESTLTWRVERIGPLTPVDDLGTKRNPTTNVDK